MSKVTLKESELLRLIEVAMDLDIYSQPMAIDANNGNLDIEDAAQDIISKMKELIFMLKSGKKIHPELKSRLYNNLDDIDSTFSDIKYND